MTFHEKSYKYELKNLYSELNAFWAHVWYDRLPSKDYNYLS